MPTRRLGPFRQDTARARDLVGLGQGIGGLTHGRVDSTDLFRAGLVQGVAALDAYVHGVVLDRAVDMLTGRLQVSGPQTKVGLPLVAVQNLLSAGTPALVELSARAHVAQRLSLESFQRPDDVARAFAMVGIGKLWTSAFPADPAGAKTAIGLIVDRRNRIVHNCDNDPLSMGAVTPLSDSDTLDAILTIENTVGQIDSLC